MSRIAALLQVRNESKLGLQICQKALESSNWDAIKALTYLTEWSKQESLKKKSLDQSDSLGEGACSFYESDSNIILSKIRCKTDFVARNQEFQNLFFILNNSLLNQNSKEESRNDPIKIWSNKQQETNKNIRFNPIFEDALLQRRIVFKEPIEISNVIIRKKQINEIYGHYIHQIYGSNIGRIVSLVSIKLDNFNREKLEPIENKNEKCEKRNIPELVNLANKLAQHVAGMKTNSKENLLKEQYLFDESITIAQLMENHYKIGNVPFSKMEIVDIHRLSIENDNDNE